MQVESSDTYGSVLYELGKAIDIPPADLPSAPMVFGSLGSIKLIPLLFSNLMIRLRLFVIVIGTRSSMLHSMFRANFDRSWVRTSGVRLLISLVWTKKHGYALRQRCIPLPRKRISKFR